MPEASNALPHKGWSANLHLFLSCSMILIKGNHKYWETTEISITEVLYWASSANRTVFN